MSKEPPFRKVSTEAIGTLIGCREGERGRELVFAKEVSLVPGKEMKHEFRA